MKLVVSEFITFEKSRPWILLGLIVLISIMAEWYGRRCGFLITPDSLQYLSSAKSFHNHNFDNVGEGHNPYWAPLFSVTLSLAGNPLNMLGYLNFACKVVIGIIIYLLGNSFLKSTLGKAIFLIASMLNVSFMMLSVFVWSELIFLSLVLINFYLAVNLSRKYYYGGLIITGFLLCMQRNAGLFYISGLCVGMFIEQPAPPRLRAMIIFFALSTSGLWAWNFYNTFTSGDFTFYDHNFFDKFYSNIFLFMEEFGKHVVPLKSGVTLVAITFMVCVLIGTKAGAGNRLPIVIVLVYVFCFSALGKLNADDIDRFVAVIMPFVFLMMTVTFERILLGLKNGWQRYTFVMILVLWLSYTLTRSAKNVYAWSIRSCQTESAI